MYIPLIIKTDYSLLSSLITVKKLVNKAKKYNYKAIGITDTTINTSIEFYNECIKNNIKPIIGIEVQIKDNIFYLYCKNYEGYKNLCKLSTLITQNELNTNLLKKYNNNLICILPYKYNKLYKGLNNIYKDIFIGCNNINELNSVKNGVFINEILSLNKEECKYINYLNMIKDGSTSNDYEFINYNNNYLYSNEEIKNIVNDYSIYEKIYNLIDLKIEKQNDLLPKYVLKDEYNYLKKLCILGLNKRFNNNVLDKYYKRLEYELNTINDMGFCNYFLVVYDYVKWAKTNNILVGPGRGSAAGSLVSYSLGITEVDPLKYDLLFERFLNKERVSMPDIDIDFEDIRRDEVINYTKEKYGLKKVSNIITYSTLASKQVIRDVGRVLNISSILIDKLSKSIEDKNLGFIYNNKEEIKTLIDNNKDLKKLYEVVLVLEGIKKNNSVHAAGIVMSSCDLDEVIPLVKTDTGYLTGFTMNYLEDLGLLKMDFLGLKNLNIISEVVKSINHDIKFSLKNIPLDDTKTLNIFKNVNTTGIFQFESNGMRKFLSNLKVDSFNNLVDAIALFRPGPIDNISSYIKRKHNLEKTTYLHDDLIPILSSTYGIIIYQEQIMQISQKLANYTFSEADILRRAMSKKKTEIMDLEKDKFITNCINNGYNKEISERTWNFIYKFASYGFNKSHSVSYSIISYQLAFLKAHYPLYFISYLLTNVISSDIKTNEYIKEAKKNNIEVLKPCINLSVDKYIIDNNKIICPLNIIKGINSLVVNEILSKRTSKFIDFYDFIKKCYSKTINKEVIEKLIYAGVFSSFSYNKKTLINLVDDAINYAELCSDLEDDLIDKPIVKEFEEFDSDILIKKELDIFGFYYSTHPISKYKNDKSLSIKNIKINSKIELILLVNSVKEINTKKNEKMAFYNCSDEDNNIDLVIFPNVYKDCVDIKENSIIKIAGNVEKREEKIQILVNNIKDLTNVE